MAELPTPHGPARIEHHRARRPVAQLLLTHGAGGGIDAPDLVALAENLPPVGLTVSLVEMPWRLAGRRVAPRPAVLDECLLAVRRALRPRVPLVLGGRSAGARCACRVAAAAAADGVLALAFPLHPPGRPETSRLHELLGSGVPTLVIQGERDPFGTPAEFPDGVELAAVPGADHSFRVARNTGVTHEVARATVVEAALEWVVREVAGNRIG